MCSLILNFKTAMCLRKITILRELENMKLSKFYIFGSLKWSKSTEIYRTLLILKLCENFSYFEQVLVEWLPKANNEYNDVKTSVKFYGKLKLIKTVLTYFRIFLSNYHII